MRKKSTLTLAVALVIAVSAIFRVAAADMAKAKEWIESEFQPSTLTMEEQMAEMDWFIKAAAPFTPAWR